MRSINSVIDIVGRSTRHSKFEGGKTPLICMYSSVDTIMAKRQAISPLIKAARGGSPLPDPLPFIDMTVIRLPAGGHPIPVSMVGLEAATASASQYLALLGQNFYPDWDASKLYVVYDTMDQDQGFEIPLWLLICMGVVAAVCLATWMYALILLPERCTSSLYKVLTMQLAPEVNSSAPMLIKSKMNPMEFEGHRAMLELEECELKADNSVSRVTT
ncbi:hypothetical protein BGZ54_010000 [Gamsiella multidivaricata]|nr:hypothetical protein BGZ54_010000 [Gamsiella multidivaricata]